MKEVFLSAKRGTRIDVKIIDTNEHIGYHFKSEDDGAMCVSDTYHTMPELYEHRYALFRALTRYFDNYITPLGTDRIKCWKSKLHDNGTMFEDSFIAGMTITDRAFDGTVTLKQITYHMPMSWWDKFNLMELERAPEYDGHVSSDVLQRLLEL